MTDFRSIVSLAGLSIGAIGAIWMLFQCWRAFYARGKVMGTPQGTNSSRYIFLFVVALLWLFALEFAFSGQWIRCLFSVVTSLFFLLISIGSVLICENGLWLQWNLVPWKKIECCVWREGNVLAIRIRKYRRDIELTIPSEDREAVASLVSEKLSVLAADID